MKKENIIHYFNQCKQSVKAIILGLILTIGISYAYAWTMPTQSPPNGNVSAPINVSGTSQTKTGFLWSNGFGSTLGGYFAGNIQADGSIGIGTVPSEKLDIATGGIKLNLNPIYFGGDSTDPNYLIQSGAWNDAMYYKHLSGHKFYTGGIERMIIEGSGRVGIGKYPAPTARLDVNGQIESNSLNVSGDISAESNNWGSSVLMTKWRDDAYGGGVGAGLVIQCPSGSYMVGIAGVQNDLNNDDINYVNTIFCRKL